MKVLYYFFLFFSFIPSVFSQAPAIQWQNTLGGTQEDDAIWIEPTTNGGYIVGGTSESNASADKAENDHGGYFKQDYWVLQLDSAGNTIWENTIGGNAQDFFEGLTVAHDDSYFIFGESLSPHGFEKTGDGCGETDMWMLNLDTAGNVLWDKCIGGMNYDYLRAACKIDGGYILAGNSASNISCEKTSNHYGYWLPHDFWILKTDTAANIIWQTRIGGDSTESLRAVYPTHDGGFIVTGYTISAASYDITESSFGYADYWIVKLDSVGNIQWQQRMGGDGGDYPNGLCELADGSFIICGESGSDPSDDKSEPIIGDYDIWLIRLDADGNTIWENTIGTTTQDLGLAITLTWDGNFVVAGNSNSEVAEIDKTETGFGGSDMWIFKCNPDGDILWQTVIGGSDDDYPYSIAETHDYGLIICGSSSSPVSGVKTEDNIGLEDYWVIKLAPDCNVLTSYRDLDGDGYGDPGYDTLACDIPGGFVSDHTDCNDYDTASNPGAVEICNYEDDDCDGLVDEDILYIVFFADADGDGFGDIFNDSSACSELTGYVTDSSDCNDADELINPAATEICNTSDDNCNGLVDEDLAFLLYFADADGDSYGNPEIDSLSCALLTGFVVDSTDCNDEDADIYPGAPEILNGQDDDCDGVADEGLAITNKIFDDIKIYPNPVHSILNIEILSNKIVSFEISRIDGTEILEGQFSGSHSVNFGDCPGGVYMLKITDGDVVTVIEFVKE